MKCGDPAFKLFGRKIPVPESYIHVGDSSSDITNSETETSQPNDKVKDELVEINNRAEDKVFKKPDKILPCPRCNSLDTKFCYFNNYNVSQPRHFCRNCQRYWTAGGTMRNVPIGAGRRKNKHLASQYRQIIVSPGGVQVTPMDTPDSATQQLVSPGETTTAMGTMLSLGDKKRCAETGTDGCGEIRKDPAFGSSMMPCSIQGSELPGNVMPRERIGPNEPNTKHPPQCYPVSPCIFPWKQGPNNVALMPAGQYTCAPNRTTSNTVQWCPAQMVAVPGFCPPQSPLQFVPAYWGCMPLWAADGGNVSTKGSNGCLSPSSSTSNSCGSDKDLLTLGKHYRELNFVEEEQSEKYIRLPKILRIDDPNEASRSPLRGHKIFDIFEYKVEGKDNLPDDSHILEANPAALSRSCTIQEST
ncbi:hypothetical protein V6N13_063924 [Hibiscus sabdariffa]|uniref:Dof-type domain-containing protein n=1 Tax=Hibiscus sabdariffa TaxID=183260 RepID=A0ABR2R1M6_9ROSI